eukprot:scaffold7946_cov116-Isochrysis_galbana.AAC.11
MEGTTQPQLAFMCFLFLAFTFITNGMLTATTATALSTAHACRIPYPYAKAKKAKANIQYNIARRWARWHVGRWLVGVGRGSLGHARAHAHVLCLARHATTDF